MILHSNGFFRLWTASGYIDNAVHCIACFTFLARDENAHFRATTNFLRHSKLTRGKAVEISCFSGALKPDVYVL